MRRSIGRIRLIGLGLLVLAGLTRLAWAKIGLSTQFVDAVVEGMRPGRAYNLRELKGIPYTVKNRGDADAEVLVEVTIPKKEDLKEGYEAIPDPSWVTILPNRHRINPHSAAFSDIVIQLPDDKTLDGRHFQANIWAHMVGGGFLAAGVYSRIRFSVGPGPAALELEKRTKAMVTLNFDLWPTALYLVKARAGERYSAKKVEKKSFKLTNRADAPLEVVFKATSWSTQLGAMPEGYQSAEDLAWVKFKPAQIKVKPERVSEIEIVLEAPESLKGQKIGFLVQLSLPIGTVISNTHRVFVAFEP